MGDFKHKDIENLFKSWFIQDEKYKSWLLLKNESGWDDKKKAHCGCPECGGGFDYFAFYNGKIEFFEIKTNGYPTLSKKQKTFKDNMIKQGFLCWVVRENGPGFYIVPAEKYRPKKKWPYQS